MSRQIFLWFAVLYGPLSGSAVITLLSTFSNTYNAPLETVALIIPMYTIPFALLQLISGAIADAFSRKKVLVLGMLAFGCSSLLISIAPTLEWLLFARFLQGSFAAFQVPIIMAIVADSATDSNRGQAFGILTIFIGLGLAIGPLIGALMDVYFSWQIFFFFTGILIIINAIGIIFLPYEEKSRKESSFTIIKRSFSYIKKASGNFQVWILTFGGMFVFIGLVSTYIYLPIYFNDLNYSPEIAGLGISIAGVVSMILGPLSGRTVDQIGRKPTLYIGLIIVTTGLLIFSILSTVNIALIYLLMGLIGAGFSFSQAANNTMATEIIPELRATVSSISSSIRFLGFAFLPLAIPLYKSEGFSMIMILAIISVILGAIIFIPFKTLKIQPQKKEIGI